MRFVAPVWFLMSEYVGQQKEEQNGIMQRDLLATGIKIPKSTSLHSLLQGKGLLRARLFFTFLLYIFTFGKIKGLDGDAKFTKLTTLR